MDQNPESQQDAIQKAYPDAVCRTEKASATTRVGRPVLELILEMIREGDKLVVWKLDRLARNMLDLLNIVDELKAKGAALEVLDQHIDTSTASGEAFLQMLGVFAQFETNLRKERQMAGIQKAKDKGKYKGRKASYSKDQIKVMLAEGKSHAAISRELGCSTKTIQRVKATT
ncbi:MAG: recombinase family protein [Pseudodesulfovibrio sp.]|nr:recombinase family protein [Pseudodesulfovibrio sp.]